jgi:hypothetical protein
MSVRCTLRAKRTAGLALSVVGALRAWPHVVSFRDEAPPVTLGAGRGFTI